MGKNRFLKNILSKRIRRKVLSIAMASAITIICMNPTFAEEINCTVEEEIPGDITGSDSTPEAKADGIEEDLTFDIEELNVVEATPTQEPEDDDDQTVADDRADTVSSDAVSDNSVSDNDMKDIYENGGGYVAPDLSMYDFNHQPSRRGNDIEIVQSAPAEERYITGATGYVDWGDWSNDTTTPLLPEGLRADNQYQTQLCWIYSSNKAMEFNIYKQTGECVNLSEKNTAYYLWNPSGTGSQDDALIDAHMYMDIFEDESMVIPQGRAEYINRGDETHLKNYLAAWRGLTPDTGNDHFLKSEIQTQSKILDASNPVATPNINKVYNKEIGHVQDIVIKDTCTVSEMKELIKRYGAVTGSIKSTSYRDYAFGTPNSEQYPAWYLSKGSSNHAVAIVGWDDNYPKERFCDDSVNAVKTQPDNDGAWYCMNSWGTSSGYNEKRDCNGGFWLSYEDACITKSPIIAFNVAVPDADNFYDHNYVGGSAGVPGDSYKNSNNEWIDIDISKSAPSFGMSYTIDGDGNTTGKEKIKAVGINTDATNTEWSLKVYQGTGSNKTLKSSQTVTIPDVGYHTVPLSTPFIADEGTEIYIELASTDHSNYTQTAVLPNIQTSSEAGYVDPENTFGYSNWVGGYDCVGDKYGKSYVNGTEIDEQLMIHLFTTDATGNATASTLTATDLGVDYGAGPIAKEDYMSFTPGVNDEGRSNATVSVTSGNTNVVTVNNDNSLTVKNAGTANVTMSTSDGVNATAKITVRPKTLTESSVEGVYTSYTRYCDTEGDDPIVPDITVKGVNNATLTKGRDYTVELKDNDKTGTATLTVKGKGNYTGTVTKTFQAVFVRSSFFAYDGNPVEVTEGDSVDMIAASGLSLGAGGAEEAYSVDEVSVETDYGDRTDETDMAKIEGTTVTFKKPGTVNIFISTTDAQSTTVTFTVKKNQSENNDSGNESGGNSGSNTGNNTGDNSGNSGSTEPVIPPEDEKPGDAPAEAEPVNENILTVNATGGEYKVTLSMNRAVPFTKKKKEVVNSLNPTIEAVDGAGIRSGISIKSVKATKPKNGASKITVKLKGSNKAERKAVKALNRQLKGIIVEVSPEA